MVTNKTSFPSFWQTAIINDFALSFSEIGCNVDQLKILKTGFFILPHRKPIHLRWKKISILRLLKKLITFLTRTWNLWHLITFFFFFQRLRHQTTDEEEIFNTIIRLCFLLILFWIKESRRTRNERCGEGGTWTLEKSRIILI